MISVRLFVNYFKKNLITLNSFFDDYKKKCKSKYKRLFFYLFILWILKNLFEDGFYF